MSPYVTLALTCCSVFIFVIYLLVSKGNYYDRFKMDYKIRNTFPFEFNYQGKFKDNLAGNLCLILYLAMSLSNYATFDVTRSGIMIFVMIAGIVANAMVVVLNFVPLKTLRAHIITAVFAFVIALVNPAAICILSFNIYKTFNYVLALVTVIISLIASIFVFILIMNPNLTHWAEATKEVQSDGTVKYIRPKYFVLAFSEWLIIFVIVFSNILLMLATFSMAFRV